MGTYAIYSFIDPEDEMFAEGLHEDDWIIENSGWLTEIFDCHGIPTSESTLRAFYRAANCRTGAAVATADVFRRCCRPKYRIIESVNNLMAPA